MKITNIFIYIKRMLKHMGIIFLLLCLPCLAFIFSSFTKTAEGARVGIYAEANADEVINDLLKNNDAIKFVVYTDKEQMKRDVETQLLECGFVLPQNVDDIENMNIICGDGYASVLSEVSKEAVFASVLKIYGDKAAFSFAKKSNINISNSNFKAAYLKYVESTPSSVAFEEAPAKAQGSPSQKNIPLCIAAIMLICAGLIGAAFYISDKKRGIYFGADMCIAASLILFLVSVTAALLIMGEKPDIIRLVIFCAGIFGGSRIFARLVKGEKTAWLFMPVVMMAVFLFDIVGISNIFPAFKAVDNILLSHYFIYADIIKLTGFSGILCVIAYIK